MDAKDVEDLCNTGPDDETTVRDKRRSRRVSFAAEITSVHVFDRDEDYETPPESKSSSENAEPGRGRLSEAFGLRSNSGDSDSNSREIDDNEEEEEEEDDEDDERVSFFRDMESYSPGSAIGSTTSNEEDNFFGPVSASFIRTGRLSDSSMASVDNQEHDITLDSKTFSLHYRSLARSDSESDYKMPTGVHLTSEEKTPTINSAPSSSLSGSFTVLSEVKKPILLSPVSGGKYSGGSDSNAMSLIESNPSKYDFARLSPTLNALLAEANKDIPAVPVSDGMSNSKSIAYYNQTRNRSMQGTPVSMNEEFANNALEARGTALRLGGGIIDVLTPLHGSCEMPMITERNSVFLERVEDPMHKESLKSGRHTPDFGHNNDKPFESPLGVSVSSLSAKRCQLNIVTPVLSLSDRLDTPFSRKEPFPSTLQESASKRESISSIMNSISKFDILDTSPQNITLNAGNQNSNPVVNGHLFNPTSITNILDENGDIHKLEQIGLSVPGSDNHLSSAAQKNEELGVETPGVERCNSNRISEKSVGTDHDEGPDRHLSSDINQNLGIYSPNEASLVTVEPDSLSKDDTYDFQRNEQVISTPGKHTRSPVNKAENMLSTPPKLKKLAIFGHRRESADTGVDTVKASQSVSMDHDLLNSGSLLRENKANTVSSASCDDSTKLKSVVTNEVLHQNIQKESGNIGDYVTPLRPRDTRNLQPGSSDLHFLTRTDPTNFKERISEKASFYGSASAFTFKRTEMATRLEKRLTEEGAVQGPSIKADYMLSEEGPHTLMVMQCSDRREHSDYHQDHQKFQKPPFILNVDNSSRKRKQITVTDKTKFEEIGRIPKNPKVVPEMVLPSMSGFQPEHSLMQKSEIDKTPGHASTGDCISVISKSSGATGSMFLSSTGKLNSKELNTLEDMLDWLQKCKKYENLFSIINSQGRSCADNVRMESVAEARWLQQMIVYEQAKLQLLRVKQEQLHEKIQLVQSGTREAQKLKFSFLQNVPVPCTREHSKNEDVHRDTIIKRLELEDLDKRIKNLSKSVVASCKLKGEPTPSETIVLANGYLQERTRWEFLRKELQIWKVDNLETNNARQTLVLNYHGLLLQSFVINHGSASNIATLNKLNDARIMKSFPNINASTAFTFVFNDDAARKLNCFKSLAVETQITGTLFGNLLDVVEEVQVACVVLRNLIQTRFLSTSAEQLKLQLCLIDFKTGHKVSLTIDITCLHRGLYPSESLVSVTDAPESILDEVVKAVGDLKAGHSRIIRLCKCVIQVFQASSM